MSYIVRQKIKGRIYLYEATSYWDKEKKQNRQKRKYIGPEAAQEKVAFKQKAVNLTSFSYGNLVLLENIAKKLELTTLLESIFPEDYRKILSLAYYNICESSPLYLFQYWQSEHYFPVMNQLYSSAISSLCDSIGRMEKERLDFIAKWVLHVNPLGGIYYDITSISSYSTHIDYVEWGYNRDKENLPQINLGVMCCQKSKLPLFYNLYPGSIVDVTTLKNCITYLNILKLKDVRLILDRGFCSTANIVNMDSSGFKFIQPLSFSLKKVKELVKKNRRKLLSTSTAFKYKEEVLHHVLDKIEFEKKEFKAHIFFNETIYCQQKTRLMANLLEIEDKTIKGRVVSSMKAYKLFKKEHITSKYQQYFKWSKKELRIQKNERKIKSYTAKSGYFVIAENVGSIKRDTVLSSYRDRDCVEKIFDVQKNELDTKRLRAHDKYTNYGRFFIKFISLILHTQISNTMKKTKLFDAYSVKAMMAEMKKIKIHIHDGKSFLSEISKKQKNIFNSFDIDYKNLPDQLKSA